MCTVVSSLTGLHPKSHFNEHVTQKRSDLILTFQMYKVCVKSTSILERDNHNPVNENLEFFIPFVSKIESGEMSLKYLRLLAQSKF